MEEKLNLVTFHIDNLWLGVDISHVREINRLHDVTPVPNVAPAILGVINLRGHLVTLLDLKRLLTGAGSVKDRDTVNVILESDGEQIGITADRLGDVEPYSEDELGEIPLHIQSLQGRFFVGVIQRRDELLTVLDVPAVLAIEPAGATEVVR